MWDALGSMSIGIVLIVVAIGLAIEIKGLLIGQSTDPESEARLRRFLEKHPEVDSVLRLLTVQLGTSLMVAVKVRMKAATAAERWWRNQPRGESPM